MDLKVLQVENESLKQEIAELQAALEEKQEQAPEALKELAARAQADLQNAKDRLERQAQDMRQFAVEGMIMDLLPTIDNFQRAFAHLPEDLAGHDWVKGVQAVEQELMKKVTEAGLAQIDAMGQKVDPELHEVLQTAPGAEGEIIEVYEEGYTLNGKVLRVAKVVVGSGA